MESVLVTKVNSPVLCNSTNIESIYKLLGDEINKAQYFCPLFSWFVVTYTYYTIGRKSGKIWKYLFYVTTFGFIANILDIIKRISVERKSHFEIFIYVNWISTYFYGLNEWGFVYINFSKIKTCVRLLKNNAWLIFIKIFLVYILICRTVITYFKNQEEWEDYSINCILKNSRLSSRLHALVYIPTGLVEIALIICVLEQYFREKKYIDNTKSELYILFHSTLGRTILISLIYIYIAIDVLLKSNDFIELLRKIFWRIKGIFGIIFLIDLFLLKLDIDKNKIMMQKELLNNKNKFEIIRTNTSNNRKNSVFSLSNCSQYQSSVPPTPINPNYRSLNRDSSISNAPLVNSEFIENKY